MNEFYDAACGSLGMILMIMLGGLPFVVWNYYKNFRDEGR